MPSRAVPAARASSASRARRVSGRSGAGIAHGHREDARSALRHQPRLAQVAEISAAGEQSRARVHRVGLAGRARAADREERAEPLGRAASEGEGGHDAPVRVPDGGERPDQDVVARLRDAQAVRLGEGAHEDGPALEHRRHPRGEIRARDRAVAIPGVQRGEDAPFGGENVQRVRLLEREGRTQQREQLRGDGRAAGLARVVTPLRGQRRGPRRQRRAGGPTFGRALLLLVPEREDLRLGFEEGREAGGAKLPQRFVHAAVGPGAQARERHGHDGHDREQVPVALARFLRGPQRGRALQGREVVGNRSETLGGVGSCHGASYGPPPRKRKRAALSARPRIQREIPATRTCSSRDRTGCWPCSSGSRGSRGCSRRLGSRPGSRSGTRRTGRRGTRTSRRRSRP